VVSGPVLPSDLRPDSLLSTSAHRQRGVDSGAPGAAGGKTPAFTHASHVAGETPISAAPVSRDT
jgi:hypothetical protein